jgi:hypothetical protein
MKSEFWELFFTVFIPALVIGLIAVLIMAAPNVDFMVWGR